MDCPIEGRRFRHHKIWFAIIAILIGCPLMAHAVAADSDNVSVRPEVITFLLGESTIVKAPWPTARVAVTDPLVAGVEVLTLDQILLQGLKVGSTDLIVWSEDETKVQQWKVQVRLDTESLKEQLVELFPDAELGVGQAGEAFVITGLFHRADQITQLHDLLDTGGVAYVDMTSLAGVQQVQLEVRVAEVSRQALRSMGISYFVTDDDWFGGMRGVSSTGATNTSIDIGVPSGTVAGDTTPFAFNSTAGAGTATLFAGFPRADFEIFPGTDRESSCETPGQSHTGRPERRAGQFPGRRRVSYSSRPGWKRRWRWKFGHDRIQGIWCSPVVQTDGARRRHDSPSCGAGSQQPVERRRRYYTRFHCPSPAHAQIRDYPGTQERTDVCHGGLAHA